VTTSVKPFELEEQTLGARSWPDRLSSWAWPSLTALGALFIWEAAVRVFDVPEFVLPTPSAVLEELWLERAQLFSQGAITLRAILLGFGLGIGVGVPAALLITYSRIFDKAVYPLLIFSQTIPKIAVAPVFIVWFGFGLLPKVLIAFLICFFPIVIDTVIGLRSVEPNAIDLIRSMGGSRAEAFRRVRIPHALPYFFSGLKIAITLAVVGAVVGEFVGSTTGLGFLIVEASGFLKNRLLFGAIIVLTVIGVALFYMVNLIERLMLPWHVTQRTEQL